MMSKIGLVVAVLAAAALARPASAETTIKVRTAPFN